MKNRTHLLYSQDQEIIVKRFDKFDKESIKTEIINHLKEHKTDVLEHCREFSKKDNEEYYGNEIINFYQNNKKGIPSLLLTRNNREHLKPLKI
jgi:hypothetical protein